MTDFPQRGEIWLVRLDPTVGSEIKKTRPTLIVSNNTSNQCSNLVTILPISDKSSKIFPFEVEISDSATGLSKPSKIRCNQVRTVDKERLVKKLGNASRELVPKIEEALKLHLGIN